MEEYIRQFINRIVPEVDVIFEDDEFWVDVEDQVINIGMKQFCAVATRNLATVFRPVATSPGTARSIWIIVLNFGRSIFVLASRKGNTWD